ncbi:sodium/solute symporter [Pseudodesulfovibrio sp. F-1]|uniref:Sodium/solute symporter n=1 Tax=Pseudodesulfovibrio alkaliphilus TaxID=2661613 RepID=A0A7K1KLI1_9BACT|nr:cation acetate symporter [Pseudodesulfovibrio alkaliphilus]MUM76934.1 sodium/solute symporter [Pseudodesulfovibrio alkaliphilus]
METGYQIPVTALVLIGLMLAFTVITSVMFRKQKTSADYYLAGRKVNSFINASAISSDYLSAASFLGVAGVAFLYGFDGIIYALGFFVGYIALLLFLASPLRKFGRYTVPDFVSERFHSKTARVLGVIGVLFVSLFYMAPQMLGAGKVMGLLLGMEYDMAIILITLIITVYVTVGGMKGTTVNQLVQFWILFGAMFLLAFIPFVLKGYTYTDVVQFLASFKGPEPETGKMFDGEAYTAPAFWLTSLKDTLSLLLALMFGTAGLPHILVRFYTAPDGKAARRTVIYVLFLIGMFYILSPYVGHVVRYIYLQGDALGVTQHQMAWLAENGQNLAVPVAGSYFGGQILLGIVVAGAFAAILSTVAGLIIACAGAIGHDLVVNVFNPNMPEVTRVKVARVASVFVGFLGIPLGLWAENMQIAILVGLAFAIAASTFFPVLVMGVWWPRMTKNGACAGLVVGIIGSFAMILGKGMLPTFLQFNNPGGFVMIISFLAIYAASKMEIAAKGEAALPHDTKEVMAILHGPEQA